MPAYGAAWLIATLVLMLPAVEAQPVDAEDNQNVAPLFASHAPLQVSIEAPLTTLMKDRPDKEYLQGTFSFTDDNGIDHTLDLKLRTRGKYRRQKSHCDFAPIRLNFRKKQVVDTVFAGQDKLKLVTHCKNNSSRYEQLVFREYLAYRLLNVMTNKSYGVRLLQINYIDSEGAKPLTKFGFVIEDEDDVVKRNAMHSIKTGDISRDDLDPAQQNLVNVFQYMIGNTEYSLLRAEPDEYCCHNMDVMSATKGAPFTPLAYDFDFAGLVNAPYAEPNPRYKLRDVRQRLYKGLCKNNDLLPRTFQQFLDNKDAIYGLVNELVMLSDGTRKYVTSYLDKSFDHISQAKTIETNFINKCDTSH